MKPRRKKMIKTKREVNMFGIRKSAIRTLPALLLVLLCGMLPSAKASPAVTVTEIDIGIRPSDYNKLFSVPETEPTVPVQVSVDGCALFGGKLKLRGSASKAIGLMTPGKRIPLELKPDQTDLFAGSVDNSCVKLINAWSPSRLLGEYLAMEMYDFLGIPSPAHTLAFLQFNGVDFGLYIASEEVNAEFLQKIDQDGGGTLFKANESDIDSAYNASYWFGFLRVVENRGLERADALIDTLTRGTGYEEYLDVDEVLRYFACLAVWGADSTILTGSNNFYLYDTGERFILIPWDSSEAFSEYGYFNGIDHFQRDQDKEEDDPPLFKLLMGNETYKKTYHDYIQQINENFLSPEQMDVRFNTLAAVVKPYLERDCTMLGNLAYEIPVTPREEPLTVNSLLETLHGIHENLTAQLNGETNVYCVDPESHTSSDQDGNVSADEGEKTPEEELNETISFLARYYSPRLDPDITEKICAAYPAWCRMKGQLLVDTDDPTEIAVAAALFASTFVFLLIFTRKNKKMKD